MKYYLHNRFGFISLIFCIFLLISFLTRSVLLSSAMENLDVTLLQLIQIYLIGAFYDFVSISYLVIPFVLYLLLLPQKFLKHRLHKYLTYIFTYILLFGVVFYAFSEWFFWDEFSVRFNFIAVDYLVYTTEVIGNIRESYPMGILLSTIAFVAAVILYILHRLDFTQKILNDNTTFKTRLKPALFFLLLPLLFFTTLTQEYSKISQNQYNNELSKSGLYSLFAAFRNNTLDYNTFYVTQESDKLFRHLKELLKTENSTFSTHNNMDISREIINKTQEKEYNVMLIVVESLSASFVEGLHGTKSLTPNLNALTSKSMFFSDFYATGTRTVRGMESITLSLPPTAGRSIVKRPDNHNMFSSGFIFRNKGYDTKFIYGGHGYFDNMNAFFSNNGFDIVDRTDFSDEEDTFHTVWGVCDEDLFSKALKEADSSYRAKKPFMSFVMTTSNHRPYDYPNRRIDIPSHSGRDGAVKYSDYAIGEFLKKAQNKPWFENTIFIIVADHCASSAGKTAIPLHKYHIPMFFYAPKIIKPQVIDKVASQIDIMPTLFSLLNWSYMSKFYGQDILNPAFKQRALVGTYQKLGLFENETLTVLSPGKEIKSYKVLKQNINSTQYQEIPTSKEIEDNIISYYQGASELHENRMDRVKNKNYFF